MEYTERSARHFKLLLCYIFSSIRKLSLDCEIVISITLHRRQYRYSNSTQQKDPTGHLQNVNFRKVLSSSSC